MAQTKQQKELMVLATLVVVATVVWFLYFGKRNTDGAATLAARGPYVPIDAVNYGKVFIGLSEAQNTEYKASGRNIFVAGPPPAPPPEAAAAPKVETHYINREPQLPPPPPPPQLNMKFFGVGTLPASGPKRAFLLDGEEVHIVSEGDSLPGNLRIIHIGNDRIEFEDTVTGLKNSKAIEMPPPA
jgi:hypothetical protein